MSTENDIPEDDDVIDGAAVFPEIPSELGIHPLLLATLHSVVFLLGSTEKVVEPGAGEEALEYLVNYMQRLRGPALERVREDMQTLYAYGKEEGWPKQDLRFLREFLTDFGVGGQNQS